MPARIPKRLRASALRATVVAAAAMAALVSPALAERRLCDPDLIVRAIYAERIRNERIGSLELLRRFADPSLARLIAKERACPGVCATGFDILVPGQDSLRLVLLATWPVRDGARDVVLARVDNGFGENDIVFVFRRKGSCAVLTDVRMDDGAYPWSLRDMILEYAYDEE